MARNVPSAIGMSWYCRESYSRILEVMEDADRLPHTYDQWLKSAEAGESKLQRAGHIVVRAVIDPDEFVAWCLARSLKVDAQARMQWAGERALRQIKGSH
jgi:hypothetical protein